MSKTLTYERKQKRKKNFPHAVRKNIVRRTIIIITTITNQKVSTVEDGHNVLA